MCHLINHSTTAGSEMLSYELQTATAMKVIMSCPEWINFVRDFNNPDGFLFSQSNVLMELEKQILAADDNHTGASFAFFMRQGHQILPKSK